MHLSKGKTRYLVICQGVPLSSEFQVIRIEIDEDDDQELYESLAKGMGFDHVELRDKYLGEVHRGQEEIDKANIIASHILEMQIKPFKHTIQSSLKNYYAGISNR